MNRQKKVKSDFVSGMGKGFEIVKALSDTVREHGGGDEHLARVLSDKSIREKIADLLVGNTATAHAVAPVVTVPVVHTIDCDADPFVPEGWTVEDHKKSGQLVWDKERVKLYLSRKQQGNGYIVGNELRKELEDQPVMNACVLDFLLAHPELIPNSWKGKYIFFWGTVYRGSDDRLYVRYLYWNGYQWYGSSYWLVHEWYSSDPTAVSAS